MSALLLKGMGSGRIGFQVQLPQLTPSFYLNGMVKSVRLNKLCGPLGGTGLWQLIPCLALQAFSCITVTFVGPVVLRASP